MQRIKKAKATMEAMMKINPINQMMMTSWRKMMNPVKMKTHLSYLMKMKMKTT